MMYLSDFLNARKDFGGFDLLENTIEKMFANGVYSKDIKILKEQSCVKIYMNLPGVENLAIDVEYDDFNRTAVKVEWNISKENPFYDESQRAKQNTRINLSGTGYDLESASAKYTNGIFEIIIPKKIKEGVFKRIEIK